MTLQSDQPHLILHKNILFKNRNTYLFAVLFWASKVVRHCTSTWQHQTPCSTPLHAVPHQQQCPTSHLAFDVPRLKPRLTHLERVGETYWGTVNERPCYLFTTSPSIPMSFTPSPSTAESMRNSDQIPDYVLHTSSFCEHVCVYRWTADKTLGRRRQMDGYYVFWMRTNSCLSQVPAPAVSNWWC